MKGQRIERVAAMTYWEFEATTRRFQQILEATGISDALVEAGIANGDIDIRDSGMDLILTGDSSDANGFFNLTIPPGDYDVQVEGPPGSLFIDVTLPDFIVSGVSDFGTIVLEQGMNLTGRAIDENGFPVARCDLDVTSFVTGRSVDLSGGRTDVFGNFNIFVPSSIALNFDTRQVFGPTLAPRQEILSLTVDTHIGD